MGKKWLVIATAEHIFRKASVHPQDDTDSFMAGIDHSSLATSTFLCRLRARGTLARPRPAPPPRRGPKYSHSTTGSNNNVSISFTLNNFFFFTVVKRTVRLLPSPRKINVDSVRQSSITSRPIHYCTCIWVLMRHAAQRCVPLREDSVSWRPLEFI